MLSSTAHSSESNPLCSIGRGVQTPGPTDTPPAAKPTLLFLVTSDSSKPVTPVTFSQAAFPEQWMRIKARLGLGEPHVEDCRPAPVDRRICIQRPGTDRRSQRSNCQRCDRQ